MTNNILNLKGKVITMYDSWSHLTSHITINEVIYGKYGLFFYGLDDWGHIDSFIVPHELVQELLNHYEASMVVSDDSKTFVQYTISE